MRKIVIYISMFAICFGSNKMPEQLRKLKNQIQKEYNIHSIKDLNKLRQTYRSPARTSSRDMGDLLGEWKLVKDEMLFHVTVGSDQSMINPMSIAGMEEAEGSITATASDYSTELKYLFDPEMMDGGDGDEACEPCDGADGCGSYYSEGDCLASQGCEWYGSSGSGCEDCDPCDGEDGCGNYNNEGDCINQGCDWYGWQDGPGCDGDDDGRTRTHEDTLIFESRSSMNYARYGAAYATDGQYIYSFCGADFDAVGDSSIFHTHGERYNPDTDTWEMFGENLISRRYTVAEYVNGNIYLFNGRTDTNAVEIINTTTGEVSISLTNPFPVTYGGSAVWNDKIYIFGGRGYADEGQVYSNHLYEFDPQDESWTRLADMPDSTNTNGVIVDGVLYTFGGYNGEVSSDINAYYIDSDVWETVGQMSAPISAHSVSTDGELIYIIGDYGNIEFSGVYHPGDNEFYDKTSNMEGRRHSSSVYLDGLYVYGGAQPEGYNDNESYTALSSLQWGELYEEDEDDGPEIIIMNMTFMDFFMLMFGFPPDSLGIENPTLVGFSTSDSESGDIVIDWVEGITFSGDDVIESEAIDADLNSMSSVDTAAFTITFNNLSLYDSTGAEAMSLSGTIGPSMWHFTAGEETAVNMQGDMFGGDDDFDFSLYLYGDSTGMEIVTEYDDYYYYDAYTDTNHFQWYATTDSVFLTYDPDEYGESDYLELSYFIEDDTLLYASQSDYPCEESGYYSYEECLEFLADEAGLGELEDLQEFKFVMTRIMSSVESYASLEEPNSSIPKEFNLYANYPNPFNPVTTIRFDVGSNPGDVTTLKVYDISGRNIATLINGKLQVGRYEAQWDASRFASGVYFSELISGSYRQTQKMILLK